MLWLQAIANCTKRGIKGFAITALLSLAMLGAAVVLLFVCVLVFTGIMNLLGPELCAAISAWLDGHVYWILGGLMAVAIGIMVWDSVTTEKKKLERRTEDGDDNG